MIGGIFSKNAFDKLSANLAAIATMSDSEIMAGEIK